MVRPRSVTFQCGHRLPVQRVFQDGFQALVGIDSQEQSPLAGSLQARRREGFGQTENAQASAISGLRMPLALQAGLHYFRGCWSHRRRPVDQARRGPLQMRLMTFGAVMRNSGGGITDKAADMRGHPDTALEDLNCGRRVARLQRLPHELVRHAVVVLLNIDVIVDVGFDRFPDRDDVALGRQRFQRRPVQLLEQSGPASVGAFPERAVVQPIEQLADGLVEVR